MWTPVAPSGRSDGSWLGLGWFIREWRGEKVISHGGWDLGFRCGFMLLPEKGLWLVVLTNHHLANTLELSHALLDVLLGFEPDPLPGSSRPRPHAA